MNECLTTPQHKKNRSAIGCQMYRMYGLMNIRMEKERKKERKKEMAFLSTLFTVIFALIST